MHPATARYQRQLRKRIEKEARLFIPNDELIMILAERLSAFSTVEADEAFEVLAEWIFANYRDGREHHQAWITRAEEMQREWKEIQREQE